MSATATLVAFDPGVSDDAQALRARLAPEDSSVAATYQGLAWELQEAALEAAVPNWDGYGGKPVERGTAIAARAFLRALQPTWPMPKILVDADGDIWFQWQRDSSRTFAVAFGPSGAAHYAGLLGRSRTHGEETTVNERLLEVVARSLAELYPDALRVTA